MLTDPIERYDCHQQQTPFGEWVRYADHAEVLCEVKRLREILRRHEHCDQTLKEFKESSDAG